MVFFTACLAIHEQRIDANRHFCGCNVVKQKKEIPLSRSCCFRCCCSGEKPTSQNGTSSRMELLTQKFLSYFVFRSYIKWPILILFFVYTGISIWQITNYKVGIFMPDYVTRNSYFRTFNELNTRLFKSNFYISFIIPGYILYQDKTSMKNVYNVVEHTASNYIDQSAAVSWFIEYEKTYSSTLPPNSTFIESVRMFIKSNAEYQNDVEFDSNGTIISTRIYVKTRNIHFPSDIQFLKQKLLVNDAITDKENDLDRNIIQSNGNERNHKSSSHKNLKSNIITLYAPLFVYTDEWNSPLSESLILIMTLVVVNTILTTIFCPHPFSAVAVVISMVSNMLGLFGLMSLLKVEMTPFSMIVIVLGACYTVDIITQTMYSFFNKLGIDRKSRAFEVLSTTSVALFNTTLASFIGQLVLFVEKSYVFLTVMKIVLTITAICFIHSAFIIPIGLSMVGPKSQKSHRHNLEPDSIKSIVMPRLSCDNTGNKNDTEYIGNDLKSNRSCGSDNVAYEQ